MIRTSVHSIHDIPVDIEQLHHLSLGQSGRMVWALYEAIENDDNTPLLVLAWDDDLLIGWGMRHDYHEAAAPNWLIEPAYSGPEWTLDVYVHAAYRNLGIGTRIAAEACKDGEPVLGWPHDKASTNFYRKLSSAIETVTTFASEQKITWLM